MKKSWPFEPFLPFSFGALLVDPPWSYEMYSEKGYKKSPEAQYETMSDDDLLAMPVGDLAGKDCILMMWAVWPKLPLAMACMERWGFKHITGGSWIKTTKDGTALKIGTGYNFRTACEPFLLGRMGPSQARLTNVPNVIIATAREHSRKPDEMRAIVERLSPNQRRLELFARQPWAGNEVWGNETTKFEGVAA